MRKQMCDYYDLKKDVPELMSINDEKQEPYSASNPPRRRFPELSYELCSAKRYCENCGTEMYWPYIELGLIADSSHRNVA